MSKGVTHQTSVPHTPQQNSHAERFNRTLLEKAEAIHHNACLPKSFWQDAVEIPLHIYNRQPMCHHDWKTPIGSFRGDKPNVSYFRVFGTLAYVWIHPDQQQDKLSPKSEEMIFIGYEPNTKGYCFWSQQQHKCSFPLGPFLMNKLFLIVSEVKRMDQLLFQSKKKIHKQ